MKKFILSGAFLFSAFAFQQAQAQVRLNVNVNINSQPDWGPRGYSYVDYYYLPDIETYYYVPTRQFIYLSGGNWVFSYGLPPMYRGYDLYHGYKVVINEPRAYRYFPRHRVKYSNYRGPGHYFKSNGHNKHRKYKHHRGRNW